MKKLVSLLLALVMMLTLAACGTTPAETTAWYVSANTGMGACLVMAEEMGAYILTDKASFLTFVANDGVM